MPNGFDFRELFVFDLANNHQGNVDHGLRVIRETAEVVDRHQIRGTMKFQFRQLETFIHARHRERSDNKHVQRFLSTRLDREDFDTLLNEVRKRELIAMCTPFDEASVDLIVDMDFDVIKVASCSAADWPLLEKIAEAGKPVIFSTGGLELRNIDDLVSFFDHRGVDFAMMYCVSIYPIPDDHFHLNRIETLRERYPNRAVGWSTHEDPEDMTPIQLAVAKGAVIFERHVGITTENIKLNPYSSTPEQLDRWIAAYKKAKRLGGSGRDFERPSVEVESINALRRGVYAKRRIAKGATVQADDVYFAMPYVEGQLASGEWKDEIVALETFEAHDPIARACLQYPSNPDRLVIQHAIHEAKALLNHARIVLNSEFKVEYSHHYGIRNFRQTGAIIIECFNRSYCKKIIVQLPGQQHPKHFHKLKEETFQVLYGVLEVEVDGHRRTLHPGETLLIQPGVWHRFWTEAGVVLEEISTTHFNEDSYYQDKSINRKERWQRKTAVDHWGRFQLVTESQPA